MENRKLGKKSAVLLKIVMYTITVIALYNFLIIGLTAISNNTNNSILGFRAYIIKTESMRPNINPGDIVIVKKVKEEKLKVNDVITIKTDNGINTHRIVRIEENFKFVVKGDNNNLEDSNYVMYSQILGKKIMRIPLIGNFASFLQDEVYIIILFIIILKIFIHYQSLQERKDMRRLKKEKANEAYQEK